MSVDKFKFAGPSIQVAEIDESRVEQPVAGIGPVVIGRTARGPAMAPVTVSTQAELERVFGAAYNGKSAANDVWRNGNQLAPTYATYAAKAFLQNSAPVTVIRTLGTHDINDTTLVDSGKAGWAITDISGTAKAMGLFLFNSGSGTISGSLVAVLYGVRGVGAGSVPALISGSAGPVANELVKLTSADIPLTIMGTDNIDRKKFVSFDPSSPNFIRKVLNTNPTKIKGASTSELATKTNECYFLAETFESVAKTLITSSGYYAAMCQLPDAALSNKNPYSHASSGIVVSQHMLTASSFEPDVNGFYSGVTDLFTIHTLNGGEWEQNNLKVSIENIKVSPYPSADPYGTFDVVVRNRISDEVLESFRSLNLNPDSDNYVAKKIGDIYHEWSYAEGRYKEIGLYPNNSAKIRVEMLDAADPTMLPFGFYGPATIKPSNISGSNNGFTKNAITVPAAVTYASASYPTISLLGTNTKSLSRTRWGFTYDKDYDDTVDVLRLNPIVKDKGTYKSAFFSLDDIGPSGTKAVWAVGTRKAGNSYSSSGSNTYVDTLAKVNAFDLPVFGGFDGVNIFEREPIINNTLLNLNPSSATNYAYNTIEVALKSISDKEVIETDLIVVPGLTNQDLVQEMIDICEQRGDAMALIDIANDYTPEHENPSMEAKERLPKVAQAVSEFKEAALDTTYAAAYFPSVYESAESIFLPATVAALGVMGGTEGNSALWFAPAGFIRGGISQSTAGLSVSRAAQHLTSKERDDLYNVNVNPLATFPNEGVVIFGQKTLQAVPSALSRINVRRLLNYIKRNVATAAKSVLFEPNVEATWNNFTNKVNPFLKSVKSNFGLEDFRVILDSKTTTADLVDRNIMYAKILLKPTKTIEYIAIDFVITNSGAVFTA
jgi:hypothetical protein